MNELPLRRLVLDACDGPFGSAIKSEHYAEEGARVIRLGNIGIGEWRDDNKAFLSPDYWRQLSSHHAHSGDLVVAGLGDAGHPVGRACVVPDYIDQALVKADCYRMRLNPHLADARFIAAFLSSRAGLGQAEALAEGSTRQRLTLSKAMSISIPQVSIAAQRSIADFLDIEATRIDALIAKKRRMMELIDERDVSLAHDAISGLAIPVMRKPTDLGWLGDIPSDWHLAPVGSQFHVKLGRMLNAERSASGDMRPYIRNINVRWDVVDTTDIAEMDFPAAERSQYMLRPGDLLINEGGAGVGRSAFWNGEIAECYFQKSVLRLRPLRDCNPAWMLECMRVAVAKRIFQVEGNLSTIPHVPAEALRSRRFPFPPRVVQDELLLRLARRRKRDRQLRETTNLQIGLLQEHRQALVTAAVTGELEVSGRPNVDA